MNIPGLVVSDRIKAKMGQLPNFQNVEKSLVVINRCLQAHRRGVAITARRMELTNARLNNTI